jgi:PAS domain S-box-containing protein
MGPDDRLLRQIIDINPSFIFVKDHELRFVIVNQAVARAYGTTVENLIGKTDADFSTNKEELEAFRRDDLDVLRTGCEKFIAEETITDATGAVRCLSTIKRPIFGDDGEIKYLLGVATDITQLKAADAELRENNLALIRSEESLKLSNLELTRLGKLRNRFIAIAAHELRTPLTSIVGYIDLIMEGKFGRIDGALMRPIQSVQRNANRLKILVDEMLDVTRIDAGKVTLDLRTTDLATIAKVVVEELAPMAEVKQQVLTASGDVCEIQADEAKVHRIVSNLVFNAIRYTPSGGTVDVTVATLDEKRVVLRVRDNGIGIPSSEWEQIFEPFSSNELARHHTSSVPDSAGLGLYIAKNLTEMHGGKIEVDSVVDEYTEFSIILPRKAAPPES